MTDKKRIYLDHAATTPVAKEVLDYMLPYFSDKFGNPSSVHYLGQEAKKALDESRRKIAELLGCEPTEIIFTSGGTESDNLALRGVMNAAKKEGRDHLIVSQIEHPAVLKTAQVLEQEGFKVDYLGVNKEGIVDLKALAKLITDKTALVSIMYANNEVGTIEPLKEIKELIQNKNPKTLFHTDAIQAFNYLDCRVASLGCDLMSLSAQKIYGPKGAGLLYIRKGILIEPIQTGGEQEMGKRAGTENIPAIVGFAKAMELADRDKVSEKMRLQELRDKLIEGIKNNVSGVHLNGSRDSRLPNNVNFCFEKIEGESLVMSLDVEGIAAGSGSACSSQKLKPSHVLLALGVGAQLAQGSLRLTLGRDTTIEDINHVISVLPSIVERLRSISPF